MGLANVDGVDPEGERQRLREHFRYVIRWLEESEMSSLETAIARIEQERGTVFESAERSRMKDELGQSRHRPVEVLAAYSSRGLFPINPDLGGLATPIFVDAVDTACASGFLMRSDGWQDEVAEIERSNNFVHLSDGVPDLEQSSVVGWVAGSGLLLEEAVVIQPTYSPPPPDFEASSLAQPGASAEKLGLRIDQFQVTQTTQSLSPGVNPAEAPRLIQLGVIYSFLEDPVVTVYSPGDLQDVNLAISGGHYDQVGEFTIEPILEVTVGSSVASPSL